MAIREVLINAIVHRNYHISAPIKIALFDNRLEIFSPGDFPGPLNPDNLRKGLTYIRNGAICKVFREAGLIEKLSSGFITLFDSYEMQGLKEPQVVEGENFIKCILPRLSGQPTQEGKNKKILRLFDLTPQITITDVINGLHIPRATAGRWLSQLTKEGVIDKVGIGKSSHYILN